MLELDHIRFSYPGQADVYDFCLKLNSGEIAVVTGRSGSGKSTLLDLIAGFQLPITGTMILDGTDLLPLPPERRPVSSLFQAGNLFDHLDVVSNLRLGLPRRTSEAEAARLIARALDEVDLSHFSDRQANQLSGGQQQRVALARTLLRDKPLLLLDEPFANLDVETATQMRDLVRRLTRQHNWHTLVVSHLTEDAETLADSLYSLATGVLTQVSPALL